MSAGAGSGTEYRGVVRIDGAVEGSLQFEAETIEILNSVSGGLDARGTRVTLGPNAAVAGDVRIVADHVVISGRVNSAEIEAKTVDLNGPVDGEVRIAANTIHMGAGLRLNGSVFYVSPEEAQIDEAAVIGGTIQRVNALNRAMGPTPSPAWPVLFLGLAAAILAWRSPGLLAMARLAFDNSPARSLGEGAIALIVPPVVITVFAATVFGIPFAVIFAAFYALLLVSAGIAAVITLGEWLLMSFGRPVSQMLRGRLAAIFCGTLFLWLMIKILGILALIIAAMLGFGVLAALTDRVLDPKAFV